MVVKAGKLLLADSTIASATSAVCIRMVVFTCIAGHNYKLPELKSNNLDPFTTPILSSYRPRKTTLRKVKVMLKFSSQYGPIV